MEKKELHALNILTKVLYFAITVSSLKLQILLTIQPYTSQQKMKCVTSRSCNTIKTLEAEVYIVGLLFCSQFRLNLVSLIGSLIYGRIGNTGPLQ